MNPSYQDSICKKVLDVFTVIFLLGTVIVGIWGLGIAKDALNTYKKLNEITTEGTLINYDRELNGKLIDKPYLQSLYVIPPSNMGTKEKAHFLVNICLSEKNKDIEINWIDIPDLYNKLWGHEDFHNINKSKLREFYNYSEDILTLIMNACWYREYGIISADSWSTFVGYIKEIGVHPIFLCAIYGCCKYSYIDKEFAEELKKIILKEHGEDTLRVIYKDMLKPEWYELCAKDK